MVTRRSLETLDFSIPKGSRPGSTVDVARGETHATVAVRRDATKGDATRDMLRVTVEWCRDGALGPWEFLAEFETKGGEFRRGGQGAPVTESAMTVAVPEPDLDNRRVRVLIEALDDDVATKLAVDCDDRVERSGPPQFHNSVVYDATSNASVDAASSFSWSHTCTGTDRALVVMALQWRNVTEAVTAMTYNSVAMTNEGGSSGSGDGHRIYCRSLAAPATGSNTIQVTFDGNTTSQGFAVSATNVDQADCCGTLATATGNNTTPTVDVTTTSGELVVDGVAWYEAGSTAATPGAGQTERHENLGGTFGCGSTETATGGTTTMSWTIGSANWAIGAIPFNEAAAPAGPSEQYPRFTLRGLSLPRSLKSVLNFGILRGTAALPPPGNVVNEVSMTDKIFLRDYVMKTLLRGMLDKMFLLEREYRGAERTRRDFLLLGDSSASQKILSRSDTDKLFLTDRFFKELQKRFLDSLFVRDYLVKLLTMLRGEGLLLLDRVYRLIAPTRADAVLLGERTQRELHATRRDGLILRDDATRLLQRLLREGLLLGDSALAARELQRSASDPVLLRDERRSVLEAVKRDGVLLLEATRKVLEAVKRDGVLAFDYATRQTDRLARDHVLLADQKYREVMKALRDSVLLADVSSRSAERALMDRLLTADYAIKSIDKLIPEQPILLRDVAYRVIERSLRDFLFLYDTVDPEVFLGQSSVTSISVTDYLFLHDYSTRAVLRTIVDRVLLWDESRRARESTGRDSVLLGDRALPASVRQIRSADGVLLVDVDARAREILGRDSLLVRDEKRAATEKRLVSSLLVRDERRTTLEKNIREGTFLSDLRTSERLSTARDALPLYDRRYSVLERLIRDYVTLYDVALREVFRAGGITDVSISDNLLLGDESTRAAVHGFLDALQLTDADRRELAKFVARDLLFLADWRFSELDRVAVESVLLEDRSTRSREAVARDFALLGDEVRKVVDALRVEGLLIGDSSLQQRIELLQTYITAARTRILSLFGASSSVASSFLASLTRIEDWLAGRDGARVALASETGIEEWWHRVDGVTK